MDKFTFQILSLYDQRYELSISDLSTILDCSLEYAANPVSWLYEKGFIEKGTDFDDCDFTVSTKFRISHEGKIQLANYCDKNKQHFFNEVRAWITVAIAVAAFVKSFFF